MRCKKMEISPRSHAIKQTMPNEASEEGPKTKNTYFSNGFCKFQVAISGAKRVHTGIIGGPKSTFFMILPLCRLQNHAPHRGRGAYFHKIGGHFVKKDVRSMEGTKTTADRIRN